MLRSILERNDFPDYDLLDAMIASALKRVLNTNVPFLKRVRVEEERAQKDDRFLRGADCLHDLRAFFRATGACEAVQGLPDVFKMRLQNDHVQDIDTRWDQALSVASEIHTEMVLGGLYKSKLQDSVRLQTALAMYEQGNVRNNEPPSNSRLKTIVRCHIDQTMRTCVISELGTKWWKEEQ